MSLDLGPNVTLVPEKSFQYPFASNYAHVHGQFNASNPYWMNLYRVVFRAKTREATLTLSDWARPDSPGGPAGQELWCNFVEVQPYPEQ